ncbi:Beta-glucuronidase [Modestobacter italicus]|uniref:Beta-glucuronidase n=1 Tax=Modestobacter italicus (strain DSM 44449 / CECT 9708 / BC 501) TaxID=2732864 RepID=I4EYL5_MODI5|nr:glycoside hydrolase family 2 TIM barrel-domain containing protein [Modestobacter marinus]CCH88478.1 Beta-glucuronidase [Modestobacter marinus]
MLRPRDAATRERQPLTELWRFRLAVVIGLDGADTYPALHATSPAPWTEEYWTAHLEMNHRVSGCIDAVVDEQVWHVADVATTPGVMRVGGDEKGVVTRDRLPRGAAWTLRRRWRGER